jgi:hypothetical protein
MGLRARYISTRIEIDPTPYELTARERSTTLQVR